MYKLQIRLLSAANDLLGWTEIQATAHGDGQLWAEQDVTMVIDRSGTAAYLSIHWVDVNVEIRGGLAAPVTQRQVVAVLQAGPVFRVGPMATGLPPLVLYAPVNIAPPSGGIGARSMA